MLFLDSEKDEQGRCISVAVRCILVIHPSDDDGLHSVTYQLPGEDECSGILVTLENLQAAGLRD